jgi:endo-1,4-beta-mannosidase
VPNADERFRLGINYWPADLAMGWLQAYDPIVTRQDFRRAAAAGFDNVRVFVRWEDAQPAPAKIDSTTLERLLDITDAAVEAGVTLIVTLFVGHMSGLNWIPAWALGGTGGDQRFPVVAGGQTRTGARLRNWYADPAIVTAQERLATATACALAGHPGLWAWDLGNENSNCTVPPDRRSGTEWLERITTALRVSDPGRPITIGIHMEDLEEDRRIGPSEAAQWCDIISMHGYPIYAEWSAGPTDDLLLPFLAEITRWLSEGAEILFEEFGLPTTPSQPATTRLLVSEAAAAAYTGRALDGLRRAGCTGALLWCFADYAPLPGAIPPNSLPTHERSFGLWRSDGTPKPAVSEVTKRAGSLRIPPTGPGAWLDIDQQTFASDRRFHLARLYARYQSGVDQAPMVP